MGSFIHFFRKKTAQFPYMGILAKKNICECYLALNKPQLIERRSLEKNSQGRPSKIKISKRIGFCHHLLGKNSEISLYGHIGQNSSFQPLFSFNKRTWGDR